MTRRTKADLERELAAVKAELEQRRRVGGLLSNIAHNIAQPSWTVDEHDRSDLDRMRRDWDAIRRWDR